MEQLIKLESINCWAGTLGIMACDDNGFPIMEESRSWGRQRGKGTLEDLYMWYKKQVKQGTTKSETDIQLKRTNTKGLEYLF